MASSGTLVSYLPAQYSAASTPSVPTVTAGQNAQNQQQTSGGIPNIPSMNFGSSGGLTNTVNSVGTSLGFGSGANVYTAAGSLPWQTAGGIANSAVTTGVSPATGALGTSATLSSTLGAAGIGAFAGNFLGKIGGNSTGGSIGGGAGAGIGMMVGGPVGAVIGGLAGGVLGGFFGAKKNPHPASLFSATTDSEKGFIGDSYDSKHMDTSFAKGVGGEFANYVKTLRGEYGIDIGGQAVFGGSDKGRNFIRTLDPTKPYDDPYGYAEDTIVDFNPDDSNSRQQAYNKLAVDILKRKGTYTPELEKQINEVGTVAGSQKNIAAQNLAAGRSAEGVPLVNAKKDSKELSFAAYTQQNNQNRWS